MATSGATAAAAAAAVANAIKASGTIVRVSPTNFLKILSKSDEPLVVVAEGGVFSISYQYLTSYKGLAFFTKSKEPLQLDGSAEIITADKIWIPG
jgi:hypothetical protein